MIVLDVLVDLVFDQALLSRECCANETLGKRLREADYLLCVWTAIISNDQILFFCVQKPDAAFRCADGGKGPFQKPKNDRIAEIHEVSVIDQSGHFCQLVLQRWF